MIRKHDFNTQWWGSPVGILDDATFFELDRKAQDDACAPYAWVEFSAPLDSALSPESVGLAEFYWVDTQIPFRIGLSNIPSTASVARLSAISAEEIPFEISGVDLKRFAHERFRFLPGISETRLKQRYALWSNLLIEKQPAWCLRILDGSDVQGWFLSQSYPGKPLQLTLAMLNSRAHISGLLLYQRAMLEYAARGARVGGAAFSVGNTPVMNIYASLGARFLAPRGHWLRLVAHAGGAGA